MGSMNDEEATVCMIFWMSDICNQFENIQKGDDVSNGEKKQSDFCWSHADSDISVQYLNRGSWQVFGLWREICLGRYAFCQNTSSGESNSCR